MEIQEILLGFDIREMWFGMNNWSRQLQNEYLIEQQIEKPLTVDASIWLSVFDIHCLPGVPEWRGGIQRLWKDITEMNEHFAHIPRLYRLSQTIAVTLCMSMLGSAEKSAWGDIHDYKPFNPSVSVKFVGYDVADHFLTSGLLSFRYPEAERSAYRQNWGKHLNKYHLFTDYGSANEFRQLTDRQIGEWGRKRA